MADLGEAVSKTQHTRAVGTVRTDCEPTHNATVTAVKKNVLSSECAEVDRAGQGTHALCATDRALANADVRKQFRVDIQHVVAGVAMATHVSEVLRHSINHGVDPADTTQAPQVDFDARLITVFGVAVEIERYMVWAAPLYVLLSSCMTHFLGAPLKTLNVNQQRKEADFRFALTHFRENSETIALARGESFEKQVLRDRFRAIMDNWYALTRRDFVLGCFTRSYFQTVLRVPMFLALPAFIAQKVTLGGLMQLASAFSRVVNTLSWFIFNYHSLVELGAATTRLGQFVNALRAIEATNPTTLEVKESTGSHLALRNVRIESPSGRALMHIPNLVMRAGEHLWLRGASGIGKSTLFRAIAGLWPYAEGAIQRPARCVFVGQQGYFPLGSMNAALNYAVDTSSNETLPGEAEQLRVLQTIFPDLFEKIPELGHSTDLTPYYKKLSGGQRQQLILARLLFQNAHWVFLDEATSAMDADREFQMLKALQEALPHATFVFLAHREPNVPFSYRTIDLEAFVPASEGEVASV